MPYKDPEQKRAWEKMKRKPAPRRVRPPKPAVDSVGQEADRLLRDSGFFDETDESADESPLDVGIADVLVSRPEGRHTQGRYTTEGHSGVLEWSGGYPEEE